MELERRSAGEIRSTTEDGIIEAYLTKFNSVDEYTSTFKPGAFKKTFQERAGKIKMLWDHDHLIGHVIECREDSYGPWVRCQVNMDTQAGKDAFAHLRAGDVDAFSFGFNTIHDSVEDGVRVITEVRCMEVSPVLFPANEKAVITGVRAETFKDTDKQAEVMGRGYRLTDSLLWTLQDIWWSPDVKNRQAAIDKAIDQFKNAYLSWLTEYEAMEGRAIPTENKLIEALYRHSEGDLNKMAMDTSLTIKELKQLSRGKALPVEARHKLADLPEEVREAHQEQRREAVKTLCAELTFGGWDEAELEEIRTLLENKEPAPNFDTAVDEIRKLRERLKEK
jgi:HK97 family phage prohead protease